MAKGLTSSYVPLGAVGMREPIARFFDDHVFAGGLTYNSHPISCAAALATIAVYEDDDLIGNARRMGEVMRGHHEDLVAKHSSVGAVRNIGLFGIVELVRSRETMEPLAPFNGTSPEMQVVAASLLEQGLFTVVRWGGIMTNPPLCITEAELAEGFAIIDAAIEIADRAVAG
jgi:taurine--2-oxoglutarate transaminase